MHLWLIGTELFFIGVFLGYVFIKHGILTSIVAHYFGLSVGLTWPTLISPEWSLKVSGMLTVGFVFMIPLLYKGIMRLTTSPR